MTKIKIRGPWPEYAENPAWEATGVQLPNGDVVVTEATITVSPGMAAQGDGGPHPKPGIYRSGVQGAPGSLLYNATQNKGWKWVRPATPEEQALANGEEPEPCRFCRGDERANRCECV